MKNSLKNWSTILMAFGALLCAPAVLADAADDVLAVVQQWADLEHDLDAQAKLIRGDREMIAGGVRQSDQASNLALQKANYAARTSAAGGEPSIMVRIESPHVAVYGNTAVVSFVRLFNVIPYGSEPLPGAANWFTLVLVKEAGKWSIAHSHVSPTGNN